MLRGQHVIVTREEPLHGKLSTLLRDAGAAVHLHPTISIQPPPTWHACDAAWRQRADFQWLFLTSRNTVQFLTRRVEEHKGALTELAHVHVACVGKATAEAWEAAGGRVTLLPDVFHATALTQALSEIEWRGQRCWLPQALNARDVLETFLRERHADVCVTPVYQTVAPARADADLWRQTLAHPVDWITFASPSAVHHWFAALPPAEWLALPSRPRIACIGPVTAVAVQHLQLPVDVIATPHTFAGLVQALVAFQSSSSAPS